MLLLAIFLQPLFTLSFWYKYSHIQYQIANLCTSCFSQFDFFCCLPFSWTYKHNLCVWESIQCRNHFYIGLRSVFLVHFASCILIHLSPDYAKPRHAHCLFINCEWGKIIIHNKLSLQFLKPDLLFGHKLSTMQWSFSQMTNTCTCFNSIVLMKPLHYTTSY